MAASRTKTVNILGVPITAVDIAQATAQIEEWVRTDARQFVTLTGVHGIMESQYNPEVRKVHHAAGMCLPDGMPTVVIGRLRGHKGMRRVYGPDLMLEVMRLSQKSGATHFFYGGKPGVAELLRDRLRKKYPRLRVAGTCSPPFRPMTRGEERRLQQQIARLAPDVLWVGLGTPRQELWMAQHVGKLNAKVMIGVGAAFDIHAGLMRQAPRWMQPLCLEWLFRLCMEPRRLWKRYLINNPRFIYRMCRQMLEGRRDSRACPEG